MFSSVFVVKKLQASYDMASPIDKKKLLDEVMGLLVFVSNVAIHDHYVQVVADLLQMSKQVLEGSAQAIY